MEDQTIQIKRIAKDSSGRAGGSGAFERRKEKPQAFTRVEPKPSWNRAKKPSSKPTPTGRKRKFDESKINRDESGKFSSVARGSGYKDKSKQGSVKHVQKFLVAAGVLDKSSGKNGGVDGLFGPKTEAAVKRWQKQNGYRETGRVTPWMMRKINGADPKSKRKQEKRKPQAFTRIDRKPTGGPQKRIDKPTGGPQKRVPKVLGQPGGNAKPKVSGQPGGNARPKVMHQWKPKKKQQKKDIEEDSETKRAYSPSQRDRQARAGIALPDGSYPIRDEHDLKNAIQAYGRSKSKERAKRHICKRARALGKTDLLPDGWNTDKKELVIETDIPEFVDSSFEQKGIRRVRTPAGVRHFGQPIGTIIVKDIPLPNLSIGKSEFADFDKVSGANGKTYYVGKFPDEDGFVVTDPDDNIVLERDDIEDAYEALNKIAAKKGRKSKVKKGDSDNEGEGDLTWVASDYPGWAKVRVRGESGRDYYIGKSEGGDKYVATDVDNNVIAEGTAVYKVHEALKKYDARQRPSTTKTPAAKKPTEKPTSTSSVPHHLGKKYVDDYNSGWADSKRVGRGGTARKFEDGTGSDAYEDGYLDHAAGRDKWETPNSKGEAEGTEAEGGLQQLDTPIQGWKRYALDGQEYYIGRFDDDPAWILTDADDNELWDGTSEAGAMMALLNLAKPAKKSAAAPTTTSALGKSAQATMDEDERVQIMDASLQKYALNDDQHRMYVKFEKAVESGDATAIRMHGHRILTEAKANGAYPEVFKIVTEHLS